MTAIAHFTPPNLQLAWAGSADNDQQFTHFLRIGLTVLLLLGVVIPLIPLTKMVALNEKPAEDILTELIIAPVKLPEPLAVKPQPKPEAPRTHRPKPKITKPEPMLQKKAEAVPMLKQSARDKASASGLLQFQDDLQAMRDSVDMNRLRGANITQGAARAKQLDRSVITSQAKTTSGGINTAALSRDVGGVALSGRETTRVDSQLASASGINPRASTSSSEVSSRSIESVRKVMDRNQGPIFSIYNRALRKQPALQGKLVVNIVIEASGKVSGVTLLSSGLNDRLLEKKLLARIRLIKFFAERVARTGIDYTFDFLPY